MTNIEASAAKRATRTFTCSDITPDEMDAFSATHPQGNFQQASGMGRVRQANGVAVSYLGFYKNGELVAATQFEVHGHGLGTFAEVHDGPLADFHDRELTSYVFSQLRARAKAAGAAQLVVTPEKPYRTRNSAGEPLDAEGASLAGVPAGVETGPDDEGIASITSCGLAHEGFPVGYQAVPRWRYLKDLTGLTDDKALLASYSKNTKRNVRIAHDNGVVVRRIGRDELGLFHDICELSCEKQGFENKPVSYFEQIYDAMGDAAEFNVAFIDTAEHLAIWEKKRDAFAADIAKLEKSLETARTPEKVERKLADVRKKHEAALRRVETAHEYETVGAHIPAAAALFIWHPRECVYLFSGSDATYAKFYAATAIQHHVMGECIERGCARYNFYGINGVFDDPNDPGRGLLEFKQGFEGYVEELMGYFEMPVRPAVYAAKRLAHKLLGR